MAFDTPTAAEEKLDKEVSESNEPANDEIAKEKESVEVPNRDDKDSE